MNERAAEVFGKRDTPVCSMQEDWKNKNEKKKTEEKRMSICIFSSKLS